MYGMSDDAMALTVAEATMQEWQVALEFIRTCTPAAFAPSLQRSDLAVARPGARLFALAPARPAARRPVTPARGSADDGASAVGGARTAYWLALAAVLAAVLLI